MHTDAAPAGLPTPTRDSTVLVFTHTPSWPQTTTSTEVVVPRGGGYAQAAAVKLCLSSTGIAIQILLMPFCSGFVDLHVFRRENGVVEASACPYTSYSPCIHYAFKFGYKKTLPQLIARETSTEYQLCLARVD